MITIITDRYQGLYSKAKFTAWNLDFDEIPTEINASDDVCSVFWQNNKIVVGLGKTPNDAYEDLKYKLWVK